MTPSNSPGEPPIEKAQLVINHFGYWPAFHDAEVVRLVLDRGGSNGDKGPTLTLALYVYEAGPEVTSAGHYILKNECLVTFEFREVVKLEMSDFNNQNVLWEMAITDNGVDRPDTGRLEVVLESSHGVEARFGCHAGIVRDLIPWAWGRDLPV